MKVIDIHTHIQIKECEDVIEYAERLNVIKMCLLGDVLKYGYNPQEGQVREINDLTIFLTRKYPAFFTGFCFLNPKNSKKFIAEEVERCILNNKLKGIKLEASTFASDKRVFFIADIAQNLNIPLLHHCWNTLTLGKNPSPECYQTDPTDIITLIKNFPELTLIVAHLRGIDIRGIIAIKGYSNVYIDTSGAQPVVGIIEYAVKKIGSERILFGSDIYFPGGRDLPVQLKTVIESNIKTKEKEDILFKNAERILKIC
ncbi:MAG: amidohydrolase family protein [bacterium]|nr:amidohydrolase family protein [bacterium]